MYLAIETPCLLVRTHSDPWPQGSDMLSQRELSKANDGSSPSVQIVAVGMPMLALLLTRSATGDPSVTSRMDPCRIDIAHRPNVSSPGSATVSKHAAPRRLGTNQVKRRSLFSDHDETGAIQDQATHVIMRLTRGIALTTVDWRSLGDTKKTPINES